MLEMLSVLSVLDIPGSGIDKDELVLFSIKSKHKELVVFNVIFQITFFLQCGVFFF